MKTTIIIVGLLVVLMLGVGVQADTFGSGDNQFTIEFVTILGATNPTSGYGIVEGDYRISKYEITVNQWQATGLNGGRWSGDQPAASINWFQAAQFVNWLNEEAGHAKAYNFDEHGSFRTWDASLASGGINLYRHKDAYYFLPTEDEWVKAAYWNSLSLQSYATKQGESIHQGDGTNGTGWNYWDNDFATEPIGPWSVGSGSEELNGTYDMMGNVFEWTESPWVRGDYSVGSNRVFRGGSCYRASNGLVSTYRTRDFADYEYIDVGFRVASIPEPCTLSLLALGAFLAGRKRRAK